MWKGSVSDLDVSPSPDPLGLRPFDSTKPLTWMLPGSFPCELRLVGGAWSAVAA